MSLENTHSTINAADTGQRRFLANGAAVAAPAAAASGAAAAILAHDAFGAGPEKVLVLHSWLGNARSFDAVKPYLDTSAYTYVFADLRGYGGSRAIPGSYTVREVADDAFHLTDHLGWNRFHLVGHSMSGMVVQRMILGDWRRPARRIKSAVAITPVTADGFPADPPTRQFLWDLIHQDGLTRQGVHLLSGRRLLPRWSEAIARHHLETSAPDAMRGYYRMWLETDFSREAAAAGAATPCASSTAARICRGSMRPNTARPSAPGIPTRTFNSSRMPATSPCTRHRCTSQPRWNRTWTRTGPSGHPGQSAVDPYVPRRKLVIAPAARPCASGRGGQATLSARHRAAATARPHKHPDRGPAC